MKHLISRKKNIYKVSHALHKYLKQYGRVENIPVDYETLLEYENHIPLYDKSGRDTLWITAFYHPSITEEIHDGLKKIYAILKAGGELSVIQHLYIDRIDICTYGNTVPVRVRVVNRLNENFDYFYVKRADASRIYGLELEHLLSPNHIAYFVYNETLIEEHIVGIPADDFLKKYHADRHFDSTRLAKEFVKFNERCFVRLLGDMHSSNFVIDITPDFEETHYRMRSIDFDQQSYEKRKSVYMPQFFKQNKAFIELVQKSLTLESIQQYQREERALIFNRIRTARYQLKDLLDSMGKEELAPKKNIDGLKSELAKHYDYPRFLKCHSMGDIVKTSLRIVIEQRSKPSKDKRYML